MGATRITRALTLAFACAALAGAVEAQEADDASAQAARWDSLKASIFGSRTLLDAGGVVELEAPQRALDAALVPITVKLAGSERIRDLYVVIDMNPAPLASHFSFGPEADPRLLKMRVRVNQYTNVHAVAETASGRLYVTQKYVKAAGGCSAPAGTSDEAALAGVGEMRLHLLGPASPGSPAQAQLMIRHPNFNGMQMNQLTQIYTPARYIRTIDVTYGGGRVFHLDSDISLSTDPVITFGFVPKEKGQIEVVAHDSAQAVFKHSFDVPAG
jgi:sulfur-oxidizing protein SoxY